MPSGLGKFRLGPNWEMSVSTEVGRVAMELSEIAARLLACLEVSAGKQGTLAAGTVVKMGLAVSPGEVKTKLSGDVFQIVNLHV